MKILAPAIVSLRYQTSAEAYAALEAIAFVERMAVAHSNVYVFEEPTLVANNALYTPGGLPPFEVRYSAIYHTPTGTLPPRREVMPKSSSCVTLLEACEVPRPHA